MRDVLFLDVTGPIAAARWITRLLPQSGHTALSFSRSPMSLWLNSLLQCWQEKTFIAPGARTSRPPAPFSISLGTLRACGPRADETSALPGLGDAGEEII